MTMMMMTTTTIIIIIITIIMTMVVVAIMVINAVIMLMMVATITAMTMMMVSVMLIKMGRPFSLSWKRRKGGHGPRHPPDLREKRRKEGMVMALDTLTLLEKGERWPWPWTPCLF